MLADTDALLEPESRVARKFQNRFRIPYPAFVELMKVVEGETGKEPWFTSGKKDASGRRSTPLRLKVLGALHVLGRGNCFDVNEQCSSVSVQLSQHFFHEFCEKFAHELYTTWIFLPEGDDLKRVMSQYDQLGFTGAMGS
ncbi:unnamed protein product, partial [Sphacelaria rigidula]